jgi:hypothetical protein
MEYLVGFRGIGESTEERKFGGNQVIGKLRRVHL